jgi:BASS family bile acid:Na+ symporter
LVLLINPWPSVALGMLLVAACPGGNVSNFMSLLAKGNAALSVSLTAFSTLAALVMTPFNFAFWGKLYASTNDHVASISLDPFAMFQAIVLVVGIPLLLGMWFATQYPAFTTKIKKSIKILSLVIFAGFIIGAFSANFDIFLNYIHLIILIVLVHNAVAFAGGYYLGKFFSLPLADTKAIAIETGIQNSALALLLIFDFFDGLGGMAIIAGWWGIWDIFSGLALAWLLSRVEIKAKVIS